MTEFMGERREWEGTATELLSELNKIAGTIHVRTKDPLWPKAANSLSRSLNEIVPNLAAAGLEVDTGGFRGKQRLIVIRRIPQETVDLVGTVEAPEQPEVPSNDMSRDLQKPSEVPLPLSDLDTVAYGDTDDTDDTISKVSKGKRKEIRI